ncbi:MAG: dihydrofolate reductase [Bacteroidales bacterium]|nr:dihydrofolate reductase [Bacteroidales bacterium]
MEKHDKKISIIVAIAKDNAIGKDNKLLAYISDDLKRFKKITTGHPVIMGRNTFLSLPKGALPNRINIVLTDKKSEKFDNCVMAFSIEDALKKCPNNKECFVIGGAMIYKQFFNISDKLYLTKIHAKFDADTFFPEIDYNNWDIIEKIDIEQNEKNKYSFSYITLKRKIVSSN